MNHPRRIITRRPESSYAHKSMGVSGRLGGLWGWGSPPLRGVAPSPSGGLADPPLKPLASEGGGRKVTGEASSAGVSRVYPPALPVPTHLCACGHVYCIDSTVTSFGESGLKEHALISGCFKSALELLYICTAESLVSFTYLNAYLPTELIYMELIYNPRRFEIPMVRINICLYNGLTYLNGD